MPTSLRKRKTFRAFTPSVAQADNALRMQLDSYRWFCDEGLGELFAEISPIVDYAGNLEFHFEFCIFAMKKLIPNSTILVKN